MNDSYQCLRQCTFFSQFRINGWCGDDNIDEYFIAVSTYLDISLVVQSDESCIASSAADVPRRCLACNESQNHSICLD